MYIKTRLLSENIDNFYRYFLRKVRNLVFFYKLLCTKIMYRYWNKYHIFNVKEIYF